MASDDLKLRERRPPPGIGGTLRRVLHVAVSGLLALILSPANSPEAEGTGLRHRIETASVLREFNTHGAHVRRVRLAEDHVAFELIGQDSSLVLVYEVGGQIRFRHGAPNDDEPGLAGFEVSSDASTIVITEQMESRSWGKRVLDADASVLFELSIRAELIPSLNGEYFYTLHNHATDPPFEVYRRNGQRVRVFNWPSQDWNCRFLDNQHLVVADPDSAQLIDCSTGNVMRSTPLEFRPYGAPPGIVVSREDSVIVIYSLNSMLLLSYSGDFLWREHFDHYLRGVSIDRGTSWLALQFEIPDASAGYFKIVSLRDLTSRFTSGSIPALSKCVSRPFEIGWFSSGVITVWGPPRGPFGFLRSDEEYWTLFLEFDAENGSVGEPVRLPGLYRATESSTPDRRYLHITSNDAVSLLSIGIPKGHE
ncbi:MAG TPA: hypothetical protein VM118_11910 [Acidobacteriota bacterium]|nr:hypothetical protein [Acidobacteriota bacterium]